jgi:uncharacterized RDD family membrane protein YckC
VTKTCLQCGAVLPSSVRTCTFCEVAVPAEPAHVARSSHRHPEIPISRAHEVDGAWRDELAHRLETYRGRRHKNAPNGAQSQLPFEPNPPLRAFAATASASASAGAAVASPVPRSAVSLAIPETQIPAKEEFSFTIAIGRPPKKRDDDSRMVIDVSLPPENPQDAAMAATPVATEQDALYTVAPIEERRIAAVIDTACLLFAYGAFLALFDAVGGEFTFSKLSGAVCFATFAIVYLQYFALFTVFGGTTPGMMLRGLEVVSFSGEPPSPRQMLLRSAGYLLSAGTFFMGFLWSMWDEDALTWHDRISQTYLHSADFLPEADAAGSARIQ